MALEAVVLQKDILGFSMKELYNMGGEVWAYDFVGGADEKLIKQGKELVGDGLGGSCYSMVQSFDEWDVNSTSPPVTEADDGGAAASCHEAVAAAGRRKRRRTKRFKNKEEVENQRMTHIAVERNRRKQMNEYLAVLRSLMPASYVQRGDQASIVGGAINFVKELEQLVHSLEANKRIRSKSSPFAGFFAFPQYSSGCTSNDVNTGEAPANRSAVADIEVTVIESHANIKIFSRWRPRQLLKLVLGLQSLRLTTLHLNVTTVDEMVLYCFSLKVEDDCQFTSVDMIATAVHEIIVRIEEEAVQD
ncbi:hypothetical protein Cni_G28758 [Canna indica]|uniref:BHLH domain-containing protein n=1 Tax=Canna indica TaxID=4628 RepID=A0AAQ3QP19_9LILI|nr:hypothetical protein Cni_G28758 [Canna indica]